MSKPLPVKQLRVLEHMDVDTWCVFEEVLAWQPVEVSRQECVNALRGLQRRGLVQTRQSDAHGGVEYAITDQADQLLGD